MIAKIIQRSKLPNRGAPKENASWIIEYALKKGTLFNDRTTGWLSNSDMSSEIKLTFPDLASAEEFAKANNIEYEIIKPNHKKLVKRLYADNFK